MSIPIGLKTLQPVSLGSAGIESGGRSGAARSSAPKDDPKKVHSAAQSFESLMIAQMLKSIRENSDSWLGTGDDTAGVSAIEMAEEELAKSLSQSGGFGLARMVEAGLNQPHSHPTPPAQKLKE